MKIKKVLVRFYVGVTIGLVASGLTTLITTSFSNISGWIATVLGSVAYAIAAKFDE